LTTSRPSNGAPSPEAALATEHLIEDIGRRSRRGGAILLAAQAIRVLGQVATLVVLARLLPPSAFGLLAMVASLGAILDLVKEFGLSAATIQKPGISHAQVSALFWINAAAGALLGAGLVLVAPLLAQFYGQPDLEAVTEWLALGFVLSGLTVQHWALLRRQMRFGAIAGLETAADLASFAVAIALAMTGKGYWALVAQRLVSPALLLAGSWMVCRWRPARPAPAEGLRELLRFGGSVTASAVGAVARQYHQGAGLCRRHAGAQPPDRPARALSVDVPPDHAEACSAHHARVRGRRRPGRLAGGDPVRACLGTGDSVGGAVQRIGGLPAGADGRQPALHDAGAVGRDVAGEPDRCGLLRRRHPCRAALGCDRRRGLDRCCRGLVRLPLAFWLATRRGPVSMHNITTAIAPAICAAVMAGITVWLVRHAALAEGAPTVGGVLLVGFCGLAAVWLAVLAWPETRSEVARLSMTVQSKGRALWSS
jgi:hypothetical protein